MTVLLVEEEVPQNDIGAIEVVPLVEEEEEDMTTAEIEEPPEQAITNHPNNDDDIEQPSSSLPVTSLAPCPTTTEPDDDAATLQWKTSHWAVGKTQTNPGWWWTSTNRVGNMIVLYPRPSHNNHNNNNDDDDNLFLWVVLGPFWYIPMMITTPLIVGISCAIYFKFIVCHDSQVWTILWAILLAILLGCLFRASWSNPGILKRHVTLPTAAAAASAEEEEWIWNDQALTFRPPNAKFDQVCAVVVTDFDHVCPWVGTAIGSGNMKWFNRFLWMIGINLVYDCVLMATAGGSCGALIKT